MSKELTGQLNPLNADLTDFYQKLRHYHWNVNGHRLFILQEKSEEMHTEIGAVIDKLAKDVVSMDAVPLHTLAHMLEESSLGEDVEVPEGEAMVSRTVQDVKSLNDSWMAAIGTVKAADDRTTTKLLDEIQDGLKAHS